MERALEEQPGNPALLATFGDIYAAEGKWIEADAEWCRFLKKLSGVEPVLIARRAWLAIRLGDFRTALDLLASVRDTKHPDIAACRILLAPKGSYQITKIIADLQATVPGSTEIIMDHARLVGGLVCSKPNEVMNRFPTAWASLAIWCPETTLQAIARFYQSLAVGEKIDISVVNAIGNYFPAVPLLAAKICSNSKQGLRILRKGLTWHPTNRQLLEEYASISPQDIWLLNHIEKHDLIPPDNVIRLDPLTPEIMH